jgi:DNA-binding CsgD family transcriptional regulator
LWSNVRLCGTGCNPLREGFGGKVLASDRHVAQRYGLAPSEARLLLTLIEGRRISDYATEAGITLNTAKEYLKKLFDKTGTSRQADLVRLILADPVLRLTVLSDRATR